MEECGLGLLKQLDEGMNFIYALHCVLDQVADPGDRNLLLAYVSDSRSSGPVASSAAQASPVIWPFLKEDLLHMFISVGQNDR